MKIFPKLISFFSLNSFFFKSVKRLDIDISSQSAGFYGTETDGEAGRKRIWIYAESIGEFRIAVYAANIIRRIFSEKNDGAEPPVFFISFKTFSTLSVAQNHKDAGILYFFHPFFPSRAVFKKYINSVKPDYFISVQHAVSKKLIKELLNFGFNSNLKLKLIFTGISASNFKKMNIAEANINDKNGIPDNISFSSAISLNSNVINVKSEVLPLSLKYISCTDVDKVNNVNKIEKVTKINLNKYENDENSVVKIISFVSVHKKESIYILKILKEIASEKKISKNLRLKFILVPRNIKIAGMLFKKASDAGFSAVYYGQGKLDNSNKLNNPKELNLEVFLDSKDADVLIVERYGILNNIYPVSDIVYVGKSLFENESGGHNILEPAGYGKAVVTGKYALNFTDITGEMVENKALILTDEKNIKESILKLIENDNLIAETGRNALVFCLKKKEEFEEYFKKYMNSILSEIKL
ncbi:MAG: 3-deoxy-D-manno-octulosonic acid transferase [Candidatus Acidulodesulfobacterium sp.]